MLDRRMQSNTAFVPMSPQVPGTGLRVDRRNDRECGFSQGCKKYSEWYAFGL
jgi:hypothetical protein